MADKMSDEHFSPIVESHFAISNVPTEMSRYELFEILRCYGAVIRITCKPEEAVFEHSDSTKRLSRQTKITYGDGCELSVKWLKYELKSVKDKRQSIPDVLLSAPDQNSPANILNKLPDECLLIIFEAPQLDDMDLMEIANVCRRFKGAANQVFQAKHKLFDMCTFNHLDLPIWRKDVFFRTFGSLITSLSGGLCYIGCEMVMKYLSSIKEVFIYISDLPSSARLITLFARLDVIDIRTDSIRIDICSCNDQHAQFCRLSLESCGATLESTQNDLRVLRTAIQHRVPIEDLKLDFGRHSYIEPPIENDLIDIISDISTIKCMTFANFSFDADQIIRLIEASPSTTKVSISNEKNYLYLSDIKKFVKQIGHRRLTDLHVVHTMSDYESPPSESYLDDIWNESQGREFNLKLTLIDEYLESNISYWEGKMKGYLETHSDWITGPVHIKDWD